MCKYPDKAKNRHSKLSDANFLSSQAPQLESVAEIEDDDDYPAAAVPCDRIGGSRPTAGKSASKQNLRTDEQIALRSAELFVSRNVGSTTKVLGLKRVSMGEDRLRANKKLKLDRPVMSGQGPLSSARLTGSLRKPFRTPFKKAQVFPEVHVLAPKKGNPGVPECHGDEQDVIIAPDNEEIKMIESAHVVSISCKSVLQ